MKNKLILVLVFVVFSIATVTSSSCATKKKNTTLSTFDSTIRLYGRLLRWQEYDGAVNMIRHQDESDVEVDLDVFKDLRVTDYEVKQVVMGEDLQTAEVEADITYYYETTNSVETIRDIQSWWYLEEAEKWFLDDDLPDFN